MVDLRRVTAAPAREGAPLTTWPGADIPGGDSTGVSESLVAAKLSVPTASHLVVPRARLFARLSQGVTGPLTVISAAAGSGKTTLVASWVAAGLAPGRVAWLTLDPHDDQPGVFWSFVVASLRRHGVPLPASVGVPLRPDEVERSFLADLAVTLADSAEPVIVVVDQFELLSNAAVSRDLDFVLRHAAPGLRLVVLTRTDPGVLLHRQLLRTEVTEIGTAEMAFNVDEAVAVLLQHGVSLPPDALTGLQEQVRGWAAGLRLSAIAMQRRVDPASFVSALPGGDARLADYLVDEVLSLQSDDVREFLLRTSIVERLRPSLADALTGSGDADLVLDTLIRSNLLVEVIDEEPQWFRYHPLFAQVLRSELRRSHPVVIPGLHEAAAIWLDEHGLVLDSARHFAAAGNWHDACAVIVRRLGVIPLLEGRASTTLTQIVDGLPDRPDSAMVAAVRAAQAVARMDWSVAAVLLDQADASTPVEAAADQGALRAVCALTRVVLARATLDMPRAERSWGELQLALSMLPALAAAHPGARALALTSLAGTQLWTGDFSAAEASVHVALAAAAAEGCEYPRMLALGKLALLSFRHGHLRDVARYGGRSLVLAEEAGLPARHRTGLGHLALAMAALEWNDRVAFDRHLDDAAETSDTTTDPVVRTTVSMMLAFRFGLDGHRAEALQLLADLPSVVAGAPLPAWLSARVAVTEAAVELRCGAPLRALRVLDRATVRGTEWQLGAAAAHAAAGDPVTARRLIDPILAGPDPATESALVDAGVLSCRLHLDAGDQPAARRDLLQALTLARPEGRRRPFVEARAWLGPFIRRSADLVLAAAWLGPAMNAGQWSGSADHSDVAPALVEPLTDRERTVLARMALAMSVADIAADLRLSINTVKTHQKSLYRKLSVQRANDAVRRGRQLQVI